MTISVIQGSPIFKFQNSFYDFNLVEYDKYLKQCDRLIYLATTIEIDEKKTKNLYKISTDRVQFIIINRDDVFDYLWLKKNKRDAIIEAINLSDLTVVKMPSITIGKWAANYLHNIHKPYFIEVTGCAWDSFWHHGLNGKLLAPLNYFFTKSVISRAEHVIYVTNEFLQRRYPNRNHNIGCSNVMLPVCDENILYRRLERINKQDKTIPLKIGTAGAIYTRYKGQEYVIKAMSLLNKRGICVEYYLAGGGSKEYLEKLAKHNGVSEHVHFLGLVPKTQMYDYYDMLDLYIHPSLAEGLPRALIEAESRALPAIGANAAGIPEILTQDCIFAKRAISAIADLIESFSKSKMLEQANINFNRAKEYSSDYLNKRRYEFYQEVLFSQKQ